MDNISRGKYLVENLNGKESTVILKSQNVPIASADLAPVHYSSSKQHKVLKMEAENKLVKKSTHTGTDMDSLNSSLTINMKEKLQINQKSGKNISKNGMRLGTTDVEVHCGPSVSSNEVNKVFHGKPSVTDLNMCLSNSQTQFNYMSSQETKCISPLSSKPVTSCSATYNTSDSTSKPDSNVAANGTICNGHTISEATSSNSITISDFSLSPDKSTSLDSSYSCSGARPRKKTTSNSSSPSIQPGSHCEIGIGLSLDINSSTSDSFKLPEQNKVAGPVPDSLTSSVGSCREDADSLNVNYINYENENQMEAIMRLIQKDLSEPYSIYTYRYFIHNWPKLCFLAIHNDEVVGAIVCKLDVHKKVTVRGYIAMLAVDQRYRKRRIGSNLVLRAIRAMVADDADEVVLETEITNKPALQLYENLGFVRDKRLFRYYLNGVDALRLKLWLR